MKVVAALSWFDEPVEFLDRCVRSLAPFADELVALDGPWVGFPAPRQYSDASEYEAISDAARAAGVDLEFGHRVQQLRGISPWPSQVEKRSALMALANERSADWVFVIDGDEWLHEPNADATRAALASTDLLVGTVVCHHVTGRGADRFSAPIRRLYRAGTTVDIAHNGYLYDGKWLHGDPSYVTLEQPFATPLTIHHQRGDRGDRRNQAAMEYRAHRRAHRTEAWNLSRRSAP